MNKVKWGLVAVAIRANRIAVLQQVRLVLELDDFHLGSIVAFLGLFELRFVFHIYGIVKGF